MLELAGHVVYDAADGVRGIELLNAVRPHVGIIDVSRPGMDGYEVARRIREKPQGRGMLLLALTGRRLSWWLDAFIGARVRLSPCQAGRPRTHLARLITEAVEGS